jgi:hypothetical protein
VNVVSTAATPARHSASRTARNEPDSPQRFTPGGSVFDGIAKKLTSNCGKSPARGIGKSIKPAASGSGRGDIVDQPAGSAQASADPRAAARLDRSRIS